MREPGGFNPHKKQEEETPAKNKKAARIIFPPRIVAARRGITRKIPRH
jgi:hypothetical protein